MSIKKNPFVTAPFVVYYPQILRIVGRMGGFGFEKAHFFPESIAEWNLLVILQH
jgi:hypothetical protein